MKILKTQSSEGDPQELADFVNANNIKKADIVTIVVYDAYYTLYYYADEED